MAVSGLGIQEDAMSNIPPAPAKSPIVIIVLLAVVGAVIALIGYIWNLLVAPPHTAKPPLKQRGNP